MALPVSSSHPMVPFTLYDSMSFPFVPQVQVMPSVAHLLPMVCSAVANEVAQKAQANAARMFCYNLLVDSYWNNGSFSEVVKIVCDLVALQLYKGHIRMPEAGVQEATSQVLTLYTSNLIFLFPDLKSNVAEPVLNAAFGNVQLLNNLKQEIIGMYNNNNPMSHHGFPSSNMGVHAHAPMQHPGAYPHGGHPGMAHPGHMHPSMGQPQMPVHHHPVHHGFAHPQQPMLGGTGFGNPGGGIQGAVTMSRIGSDPGNEAANIRQDRYFTRPQPVVAKEEPRAQSVNVPVAPAKEVAETHLIIQKGSEMERSKHQVTLLGESYSTDTLARSRQFADSVDNLVQEKPTEESETPHLVHPCLIMETSLESALITGRVKQFEHQAGDAAVNVFRCFAFVTTPMICIEDISSFVDNLRQATSFTQLVIKIKSMATSLSIKSQSKRYSDTVVSFLKRFDNQMTEVVNDFLKNKLGLSVHIDSFTDDASDLPNYIHSKYGTAYAHAYAQFENEVIVAVLEKIDDEHRQDVINLLDIPDTVHTAIFPVNYSMTFTFMNDKELGYEIKDKAVVIDPRTAPSLYKIAQSLSEHKRQMQITTIYDLLVTADDARYKLYRNYVADQEYKIARA